MEGSAEVNEIVERLHVMLASEAGPPAMVVMGPGLGDEGDALRGNRGGFLHLAIASLKAAEGEVQSFDKADWVCQYEQDWVVGGLKPDPNAHDYFPKPESKSKSRQFFGHLLACFVLIAIVGCLLAGIYQIAHWCIKGFD